MIRWEIGTSMPSIPRNQTTLSLLIKQISEKESFEVAVGEVTFWLRWMPTSPVESQLLSAYFSSIVLDGFLSWPIVLKLYDSTRGRSKYKNAENWSKNKTALIEEVFIKTTEYKDKEKKFFWGEGEERKGKKLVKMVRNFNWFKYKRTWFSCPWLLSSC